MKIALEDKIGGNDDPTYGATYGPYLNNKSRTARCGRDRSDIQAAESTYGPYLGLYLKTGHCPDSGLTKHQPTEQHAEP